MWTSAFRRKGGGVILSDMSIFIIDISRLCLHTRCENLSLENCRWGAPLNLNRRHDDETLCVSHKTPPSMLPLLSVYASALSKREPDLRQLHSTTIYTSDILLDHETVAQSPPQDSIFNPA